MKVCLPVSILCSIIILLAPANSQQALQQQKLCCCLLSLLWILYLLLFIPANDVLRLFKKYKEAGVHVHLWGV